VWVRIPPAPPNWSFARTPFRSSLEPRPVPVWRVPGGLRRGAAGVPRRPRRAGGVWRSACPRPTSPAAASSSKSLPTQPERLARIHGASSSVLAEKLSALSCRRFPIGADRSYDLLPAAQCRSSGRVDAPGVHVHRDGLWDLFGGCGACRGRRSTWGSWRM
jgi:hypothetical protein